MPLTKTGKKVMAAMMAEYGPEKGKAVFYAKAHSMGTKWHHSPDCYEADAVRAEAPPRTEYHGQPENLNTSETPKKAGQGRGSIQASDGTDSPRAGERTKAASVPDTPPGGEQRWPGAVDTFGESASETP